MNESKSNKIVSSILLSFGLTWRATCLLFTFITLFNSCSIIFVYLSDKQALLIWASALIPLIIFNGLLGIAIVNPNIKKKLEEIEIIAPKEPKKTIGRNVSLSFACYGTFVALTIILFVFIVAFDLVEYIEYILVIWLFIGGPLFTKILWNFYSTRLK